MVNEAGDILECFSPQLDEIYTVRFEELTKRIDNAFPNYRSQLVQNELRALEVDNECLASVRYAAVLNVLIDLCQQGWQLEVHDKRLFLKMTAQDSMDKAYIRYRLSSERKAQFQEPSIQRFVNNCLKC